MTLLARTNSVEKENWATATHRSTRPAGHINILWYGGTSMIETRPKLLKTLGRLRSIRASPVARVAAYGLLPASGLDFFPRQTRLTRRNCLLTEEHAGVASRQRRLRIWRIFAQETNTKIVC